MCLTKKWDWSKKSQQRQNNQSTEFEGTIFSTCDVKPVIISRAFLSVLASGQGEQTQTQILWSGNSYPQALARCMKNIPENVWKQFSNLQPYSYQFFRKWIITNIFLWVSLLSNKNSSSWSCPKAVSKPVWHITLLCVEWKTPDYGQKNCPKHVEFYSKNKFEKLVHLVGFIIRTYHNARSPERQMG